MVLDLFLFIGIVKYCVCFNISDLQSSREKISRLLDDDAIKGQNTGYNVAKIKLANEVIIQLMVKGSKKEHGEEILRLISEYTVGMNENTLDIVTLNDIKSMWRVYDDIFGYGKPPFIEYNCDLTSMKARFHWDDRPINYFKYIREDALKAWLYFAKQFTELKNKLTSRY